MSFQDDDNNSNFSAQRPRGTGFTNIQRYLGANVGAGERLGQGVQQYGQRSADRFGQAMDDASEVFDWTASQLDEETGIRARAGQYAGQIQEDATGFLGSDEDTLSDYRKLQRGESDIGQYQQAVPEHIRNIGKHQSRLRGMAEAAQTEEGRFGLLREAFQRPGYTRGAQSLDQTLLQTESPEALTNLQQQLGSAYDSADLAGQDYTKRLDQDFRQVSDDIRAAQEQFQYGGELFGGWEGDQGMFGDLYGDLSTAAGARQAELLAERDAIAGLLNGRNVEDLSLEEINMIRTAAGMDPLKRGQYIEKDNKFAGTLGRQINTILKRHGVDIPSRRLDPAFLEAALGGLDSDALRTHLSNVRSTVPEVGMGDVASEEQRAQLEALKELAAVDDLGISLEEARELGIDTSSLQDELSGAVGRYEEGRFDDFSQLGSEFSDALAAVEQFQGSKPSIELSPRLLSPLLPGPAMGGVDQRIPSSISLSSRTEAGQNMMTAQTAAQYVPRYKELTDQISMYERTNPALAERIRNSEQYRSLRQFVNENPLASAIASGDFEAAARELVSGRYDTSMISDPNVRQAYDRTRDGSSKIKLIADYLKSYQS